jgi:hypothetical protein
MLTLRGDTSDGDFGPADPRKVTGNVFQKLPQRGFFLMKPGNLLSAMIEFVTGTGTA